MPGGGMASGTDYQGPTYMSPRELFPDDRKIRPWLLGSWWTLPTKSLVQMIGLGVRLGSTPLLVEAEGTTTDGVHLRGTYLRIRTDNSWVFFRSRALPVPGLSLQLNDWSQVTNSNRCPT